MEILHYIFIGLFALIGIGILISASALKFRNLSLVLGGLSYLGGALGAYVFSSWWFLLIAFGVAWLVKLIFE